MARKQVLEITSTGVLNASVKCKKLGADHRNVKWLSSVVDESTSQPWCGSCRC